MGDAGLRERPLPSYVGIIHPAFSLDAQRNTGSAGLAQEEETPRWMIGRDDC
jgi:hypothetical protein